MNKRTGRLWAAIEAAVLGYGGIRAVHRATGLIVRRKKGNNIQIASQQFQYIAQQVKAFRARHRPVISIDTKKKENISEFKNAGQEWQPKGVKDYRSYVVTIAIA